MGDPFLGKWTPNMGHILVRIHRALRTSYWPPTHHCHGRALMVRVVLLMYTSKVVHKHIVLGIDWSVVIIVSLVPKMKIK